jgi:nucleoside phosphorylase
LTAEAIENPTMTLSHEDYTVGWICALSTERVAAHAMLDEVHNGLPSRANDSNIYVLGRIGQHNVAIACLPEYGTVSAAKVATMMQFSFPSIRFSLMVGIGGGIPSALVDIRLGDIVVSAPTGTEPGVVQYDLGRIVKGGDFQRTGTLNKPPTLLLNAVNALEAKYGLEKGLSELISKGFKRHFPDWAPEREYRGAEFDRLFVADYSHVDDKATCDDCDSLKVVIRTPRSNSYPVIHYGNIASGNLVMKDALIRDRLATKHHFICFEMEAAGLMDDFHCLVIRGISDYSDSHKNSTWQPYAAATAAAYGKALLLEIPPEAVKRMEPIKSEYSSRSISGSCCRRITMSVNLSNIGGTGFPSLFLKCYRIKLLFTSLRT